MFEGSAKDKIPTRKISTVTDGGEIRASQQGRKLEMALSKTDLGHLVKYTGDLIPATGRHFSCAKALAFALPVKTGGKERISLRGRLLCATTCCR